uniref:acyltransferase family protein n=1 Tax=Clostridium sp. 12(A) TaxID=1163671 RepID=UPI0004BC5E37|nr:acyltransferase family protein [Clostridium sp. 12(A)]
MGYKEEHKVEKKRIDYLDVAKGIGIISVIIGHYDYRPPVQNLIFSFHMPIFFILSGYFFKNVSWNELIKKKTRQLIIPYVFTSFGVIISSIIWDLFYNINNLKQNVLRWISAALYGSGNTYETPYYIPQIGAIWFLLALFSSLLILKLVIKHKYAYLEVGAIALIGYYSSKLLWLPFSIQAGMVAVIYVYVGYLLRRYKVFLPNMWKAFILSAMVWGLYLIKGGGHLYLVANYFQYGVFDILASFCACVVVIYISEIISKLSYFNMVLGFMGRNSLIILCFHLIELNTFRWDIIGNYLESDGIASFYVILIMKILWAISGIYLVRYANYLVKKINFSILLSD